MTTQKEIAQDLDRLADRADLVDATPATGKQCWYLAKLILEAGDNAGDWTCDTNAVLTKKKASEWITFYLDQQKRDARRAS